MTYRKTMQMFLAVITVVALAGSASAIDIINAGFEDPAMADGTWDLPGSGWSIGYYDHNGTSDTTLWHDSSIDVVDAQIWNPDEGSGYPGGVAPEGENVGYAVSNFREAVPPNPPFINWDTGLSQVLTDTLQASTQYVLSAQVGNPLWNESEVTANYRLELLAGGVLLGTAAGASPRSGQWAHHSVTFTTDATPAQLGEPLEIRVIAERYKDTDDVDEYEVDFDAVSLTAGPLPEVQDIPIVNPGFEYVMLPLSEPADLNADLRPDEDPLEGWSMGYYDDLAADPTVWTNVQDDGNIGIWWPDTETGYASGAAEGQNAGYAVSPLSLGDPDPREHSTGLQQVLTETLEADTQYTLTAEVGNPEYNDNEVTADYRLELLAGGVVLATDTGASPGAGAWESHSLIFKSGAEPALLGEPLEIRLIANSADNLEVDFDNIRLTAGEGTIRLGDVNLDGVVNGLDVDPFVDRLLNGPFQAEADMNEDGEVNGLDVDPFVDAVVGGGTAAVPEPSTVLLALFALAMVGGWRKLSRTA